MRIGIEAQRIFRKKKHGMDVYALQLIRNLQKEDHENEYFIFLRKGEDVCLEPTDNFTIVEVPGLTYLDWEQIWLPYYAGKYNLDVLHCTSNTAPLLTSIPLILTLHDIIYLTAGFAGGTFYQRLGHWYRKWIVPPAYRKAIKVITVSKFERDVIRKGLNRDKPLMVTYNGVDAQFGSNPAEDIKEKVRQKFHLPEKYLFFLGNAAPKKNMKGMLQAYNLYVSYAESEPIPMVVAETTSEQLYQMLKNLDLLHLMDYIQPVGYVDHQYLPIIYHMAEVFLYPSLRESFGIPPLEAMACGTPVITSKTSSLPEVVSDAALLIDPKSPADISNAIEIMTENRDFRKVFVNRGLQRASKFSWANTAQDTLRIYTGRNATL